MAKLQAHLLLNARSRQSDEALSSIKAALAQHGIAIEAQYIIDPAHPRDSVYAEIVKNKPALLIVGGGDGTISDALEKLAHTGIEISIIPLGTTNNFARSLNIPLTIDAACEVIATKPAKPVDLGMMNETYFANVVGVGLSARIAQTVTDRTKRRFGRFAYAITGLRQLLKHKPFMATLYDKDRELVLHFQTRQIIIANGRYHAGKQIAKDARVDNRELIVFALGGPRLWSFLWHLLDFYGGSRKKIAHSSYVIGKNVRIETDSPQPVEVDGETVATTPLAFNVAAKAVKVRF